MAFAPPIKAKVSTHMAKSTWTPLNNPSSNNQMFDERRDILKKWFSKWHDHQKKIIVGDIINSLSHKHLVELNDKLNCKFPQERFDFTKILPRVLSLYLFSFLDPRTLCRCSQVSWYWNYLTELDCVWRPKCLRFGWYPTYQPTPFEEKIWKRFYVKTVHELNYAKPKLKNKFEDDDDKIVTARSLISQQSTRSNLSSSAGLRRGPSAPSTKKPLPVGRWEPPPWRGSDPKPIDTVRYNYLDNSSKYKRIGTPKSKQKSYKKMSSTLNSSRDLNTTHQKSISDKKNSSPMKDQIKVLEESLNFESESQISRNLNKTMSPNALKTLMKSTNDDNKDLYKNFARISIDAGKRPKPIEKVNLNKKCKIPQPKSTNFTEDKIDDIKFQSIEAAEANTEVAESKLEDVETKPDTGEADTTINDSEQLARASTSDLQGSEWRPVNSDDEDF